MLFAKFEYCLGSPENFYSRVPSQCRTFVFYPQKFYPSLFQCWFRSVKFCQNGVLLHLATYFS